MINRYPFHIEWSEEDQEYVATCAAFPGLSAFGSSEKEALKEAKIALAGFVETCEANSIPLPEPTTRELSGKLQLRLPKSLHGLAARMAALEEVSLNTYIADAVRARVTSEQVGQPIIQEVRRHLQETRVTAASLAMTYSMATPIQTVKTIKEVSEKTLFLVTSGESGKGQ